jgi:hypothetical protein
VASGLSVVSEGVTGCRLSVVNEGRPLGCRLSVVGGQWGRPLGRRLSVVSEEVTGLPAVGCPDNNLAKLDA